MLGLLGLAIVGVTGWKWFQLIQGVAVPRDRRAFHAAFLAGGVIGIIGAIQGPWFGTVTGGLAAVAGLLFPALRLQSAQRADAPAVAVGDPMLRFSAPDETGADFDLGSLTGKPYLLKFFRGHW